MKNLFKQQKMHYKSQSLDVLEKQVAHWVDVPRCLFPMGKQIRTPASNVHIICGKTAPPQKYWQQTSKEHWSCQFQHQMIGCVSNNLNHISQVMRCNHRLSKQFCQIPNFGHQGKGANEGIYPIKQGGFDLQATKS